MEDPLLGAYRTRVGCEMPRSHRVCLFHIRTREARAWLEPDWLTLYNASLASGFFYSKEGVMCRLGDFTPISYVSIRS